MISSPIALDDSLFDELSNAFLQSYTNTCFWIEKNENDNKNKNNDLEQKFNCCKSRLEEHDRNRNVTHCQVNDLIK
jgi:hypothetical protein